MVNGAKIIIRMSAHGQRKKGLSKSNSLSIGAGPQLESKFCLATRASQLRKRRKAARARKPRPRRQRACGDRWCTLVREDVSSAIASLLSSGLLGVRHPGGQVVTGGQDRPLCSNQTWYIALCLVSVNGSSLHDSLHLRLRCTWTFRRRTVAA